MAEKLTYYIPVSAISWYRKTHGNELKHDVQALQEQYIEEIDAQVRDIHLGKKGFVITVVKKSAAGFAIAGLLATVPEVRVVGSEATIVESGVLPDGGTHAMISVVETRYKNC